MRSRHPLAAVALFLLAACAAEPRTAVTDRLSLSTNEAVMSYSFEPCSASISGAERNRIRDFLTRLGLTRGDVLVVSVPKNRLPQRDSERLRTLAGIFAAFPASVRYIQDEDLRELPRSEPTGIIRVVRASGIGVTCDRDRTDGGCSNATNLAAMIEDPSDLFMPATGRRYYPSASTPAPAGTTGSGSLSGSGAMQ